MGPSSPLRLGYSLHEAHVMCCTICPWTLGALRDMVHCSRDGYNAARRKHSAISAPQASLANDFDERARGVQTESVTVCEAPRPGGHRADAGDVQSGKPKRKLSDRAKLALQALTEVVIITQAGAGAMSCHPTLSGNARSVARGTIQANVLNKRQPILGDFNRYRMTCCPRYYRMPRWSCLGGLAC